MKHPHTISIPDDIWEYLSKSGNASETIRQLVEEKMDNFGTVNSYKGKTYRLTEYATLSNRVFPGWFGDAAEGEMYIAEYWASAVDSNGDSYQVVWHFDTVRGEEPEDESNYPWDDAHVAEVNPQ